MTTSTSHLSRGWNALLATALTTAGLTVLAPAAHAGEMAWESPALVKRVSSSNMAGFDRITEADAVDLARRYDVIIGTSLKFRGLVPAMHAANPALKVLIYVNAAYGTTEQATSYPESWYARDANGLKITSRNYSNYLMDVSNVGWQADVVGECTDLVTANAADGCWLDMLNDSSTKASYVSAVPVHPGTVTPFTSQEWWGYTGAVARAVHAAPGVGIVAANGAHNGTHYVEGSDVLTGSVDMLMAECWLRYPGDPLTTYAKESAWKADVDMLVDAGARGASIQAVTKTWAPGTTEQKDVWHQFALASFLLGTDGRAGFTFTPDQTWAGVTPETSWESTDLGTPTGPYALAGGVYQRRFTGGLSLVNPTTLPVTVALAGSYTDLRGATRSGPVVLAPHTGMVLRSGSGPAVALANGPTAVTDTGMVVTGAVNTGGTDGLVSVQYGATDTYGSTTGPVVLAASSAQAPVGVPVPGLPGTALHWRVVLTTPAGTVVSPDQLSATAPSAPLLGTTAVTDTRANGATLQAEVSPGNGDTTVTVQYGLTRQYGATSSPLALPAATAGSRVAAPVQGLSPVTAYHARLVATNASGTVFGPDVAFKTLPLPPQAATALATGVSATTATLTGRIRPVGASVSYRFEFGATTAYGSSTATRTVGSGTTEVTVSQALKDLPGAAVRHYRLVATSTGGTTYGADVTFSTLDLAPAVVTRGLTNLTNRGANVSGTVNSSGQATTWTYQYGLTSAYGQSTTGGSLAPGGTDRTVGSYLGGLASGTTYHYRLVATNAAGTTYGADLTFRTL